MTEKQDPRTGLIAVKANIDGKTITLHPDDIVLVYNRDGRTMGYGSANPPDHWKAEGVGRVEP